MMAMTVAPAAIPAVQLLPWKEARHVVDVVSWGDVLADIFVES